MPYNKYYSEGWKNNEEGNTPITAAALNHMEDGIVSANNAATTTAAGLMSAQDKSKLDGIAVGAKVTSVRGSNEQTGKTGDVILTSANIGAFGSGSLGSITTANNNNLYGSGFFSGVTVTGLPSTNSSYELLCFGNTQLAILYNGGNPSTLYRRYYVNSQWYSWSPIVSNVSGVKGDAESTYRTGNINITSDDIGTFVIMSNDDEWSDIYGKLSKIAGGKSAFVWIQNETIATKISGRSDLAWSGGIVTSVGNGGYRFTTTRLGDLLKCSWQIWNLTSASATPTVGSVVIEVSGVKGAAESTYKVGNVSLSAADVGAKAIQTAVSSPTASGTTVAFIDTISQDTQGKITATKKTVSNATTSSAGLLSSSDKVKLDASAPVIVINQDNWAGIYAALNALDANRTATIQITSTSVGMLTGGKLTGAVLYGTVNKYNVNTFHFLCAPRSSSNIYQWTVTNLPSSGTSTISPTVYRHTGTAI